MLLPSPLDALRGPRGPSLDSVPAPFTLPCIRALHPLPELHMPRYPWPPPLPRPP